MSRLSEVCNSARQAQRKLLIPYLVAGDPDLDTTLRLMLSLVEQGADIIELGFPFSDPASDGPVIQRGVERALAGKVQLVDALALVQRFRELDAATPVVLMGYLNPIEIMGYGNFAERASAAGIDGVLVVDMPPTEAQALKQALADTDIDTIFLVAPTTTPARIEAIIAQCSGYLYYVSLKGVTGAALSDTASVRERLDYLRQHTDLPVVIGFGIKDAASAAAMGALGDGIVIGSALVSQIEKLSGQAEIDDSQIKATTAIIRLARTAIDDIK